MSIETFFLTCGIVATVAFILKVAIPFDSGTEITSDFTDVADFDSSFNIFTFEGICAFFMSTGWMGWFLKAFMNFSSKRAIIISIVIGIMAILFYAWLISKIKKLEHIPHADLKELVDKTGKAYMKFAPNGQSKIEIEFNSRLQVLDAVNTTDSEIQSFEIIKVVDVKDNVIYIKKA